MSRQSGQPPSSASAARPKRTRSGSSSRTAASAASWARPSRMPASFRVSAAFIAVRSSGSASRNATTAASSSFLLRSSAMDALTVAVVRRGDGRVAPPHPRRSGWAPTGRSPRSAATRGSSRSCARPPSRSRRFLLVRSYDDLAEEDVAIAAASHHARAEQLAAVRGSLRAPERRRTTSSAAPWTAAGSSTTARVSTPGFLCVCAAQGWPFEDYRLRRAPTADPGARGARRSGGPRRTRDPRGRGRLRCPHLRPLPRAHGRVVRTPRPQRARGRPTGSPRRCGRIPLSSKARARRRPRSCRPCPARWPRAGAEGVLCIGLPTARRSRSRSEDGSSRGLLPAAAALLDLTDLRVSTIRNSRGEAVGEIIAES